MRLRVFQRVDQGEVAVDFLVGRRGQEDAGMLI